MKGVFIMKKRSKSLITVLVLLPIVCIIIMAIGIALNIVKLAVYIILALVLLAVISKICMVLISAYKSYSNK